MTSTTLDQFFRTAFHHKFAEQTCSSLGISKATIDKAYREVEGMVGYLDAIHTNAELFKKYKQQQAQQQEEAEKSSASSSTSNSEIWKRIPKINYEQLSSLIFTDGEEWVLPHMGELPFTSENRKEMFQHKFYEHIGDAWPKQWFRKVGERKAQLQIPLANLLPPACFVDDHREKEEKDEKEDNVTPSSSSAPPPPRSAVFLPPNLQKLAILFEKIMSKYLEQILLEYNLIPSAIQKGLFPGVTNAATATTADTNANNFGRSKLLARMKSKSVLRMWVYFGHHSPHCADSSKDNNNKNGDDMTSSRHEQEEEEEEEESCRGHFDPGVCTILLSGSKSGLQVHKSFVGLTTSTETENNKSSSSSYEFATHDAKNEANEQDWINIGYHHHHEGEEENNSFVYNSSNVVLMNDTMLQVLTGGVAQHAFHRVLNNTNNGDDDDGNTSASTSSRIQIVLEYRPDNAAKFYSFVPTDDEKERCAGF